MASIVSGFEYDIFISYRHNDNRSGWVTDFVNALQEELAATIKEPLSVYFDKNPHDGLLETHNVDKSLEGKLKCLLFIPIISQTYCDPKSFAWQHEFVAFNKLAKEDQFGRDIRVQGGNVTSRILPIKIHDLDAEDKATIEKEIGGALRAIEFIYKEAGVNRPLKSTDSKSDNQNKTDYRNQINKVANALKEIITAIKNPTQTSSGATRNQQPVSSKQRTSSNKKIFIASLAVLLLAALGYFFYQQRSTPNEPSTLDKSIAVLPFENMSGDAAQEYFSDGISEEILNALAQIEGLKVTGRTSSFQFKDKGMDLKQVGEKLGVATILEGSIRKQNDLLRINVQLVNTSNGYHLWSERYDRKITDMFAVQDEIAQAVSSKLKLTLLNQPSSTPTTKNQEAYDLYLRGRHLFNQRGESMLKARELLSQAIAADSTFSQAYATLALNYAVMAFYNFIPSTRGIMESRKFASRAIKLDPSSSDAYTALGFVALHLERDGEIAKEMFTRAIELNPNSPLAFSQLGNYHHFVSHDFKQAEALYKKSIFIDPLYFITYTNMAALQGQNNPLEGLNLSERGLELNRTSVLLIIGKSNHLWNLKRPEEAIQNLQTGLALTNRHQNVVAQLCELYAAVGDMAKANELYNELKKRTSSEYISSYNLARVSFATGREQEARELFIQAIRENNSGLLTRNTNHPFAKFQKLLDQLLQEQK